ncbi:MAG: PHP domain-containing protein [Clostridia bacterium]|nr:PHP domain-containing protein [Clostridia bacterium]
MRGDLHCHTKLSDGSMGIDDLIVLAKKREVDTIAITDLDCLAGTTRAKLIGERHGINVIQGVELSSYDSESEREVHILSYLNDSPDRLEGLCHRNLAARKRAAQYMMLKAAQRYPITPDLVLKCAQGSTNVYPVHIMAALVESGMTTELYGELYNELFNSRSSKNIIVRPKLPDPVEIIEAIHEAGGIAVLARACSFSGTNVIERLAENGLDGLEIWHPGCDDGTSKELMDYAEGKNMITVGGSVFKGRYNEQCVTIGTYITPEDKFNDFMNYKAKNRRQHKAKVAVGEK